MLLDFLPECELAWLLVCTLLVTQAWPVLFQLVSWLGLNVHSSGDTDVPCLISECEFAWIVMYTLLVIWIWPVLSCFSL